ncbi:hypothetical protein G7Y89_g12149 [Cudoniella acicularis]|uniref:FAD linked oxidase N-terminal domain-containing protein n=1 Tax=Cudoniella acicularis TaxID=354080 RepID=A0A8H4RCD9_9HELO|nr:hypothetical protein G7Y89_g12149 [Cudoniella acicularis]
MRPLIIASVLLQSVNCFGFPWEDVQLTEDDVTGKPDLAFGDASAPTHQYSNASCRTFPGDASWPSPERWSKFNDELEQEHGPRLLGKSTGAGSLSIWTRHLQGFEYYPTYTIGNYTGQAAHVGAGLQSFELGRAASQANVTIIAPGGSTVGAFGGFFQGGGHSAYTSFYGLGADQIIAINIVTADGRYITVDQNCNEDLYFAMRGGGPVTSVITKAHPLTPISTSSLAFSTSPLNYTGPFPAFTPTTNDPTFLNTSMPHSVFWAGIKAYFRFSLKIADAGGIGYNFIRHASLQLNGSTTDTLLFTTSLQMVNMSADQAFAFAAPLIAELNALGISIANPTPYTTSGRNLNPRPGDAVGGSRLATRLFPRKNFESEDLLEKTTGVIKRRIP